MIEYLSRSSMHRKRIVMAGGVFLLVIAWASALFAQEFRATLTGQVTDPSGAVVAAAEVVAVNNATQQTYTATTNKTGTYNIPYVLPGTYTMTVKASGFATKVQDNVLLQASESRGLNFQLQLGSTTQEVTVTGAPPLVDSVNASTNTVLSTTEIANLPLNGRQIYMLLETTPASQFTTETFGATGNSGTRGWDVSNAYVIGGAVQGYEKFTLNGTNITSETGYGSQGTWMTAPNVDALQEVNVMTNTYDARYGQTGGGTVNMVTKSGTNQFHGDAYDYLEAGDLNANNIENNLNGIARQNMHQDQYGGTFGGPIKKDKIFFFGSFEGYFENIPFTTLTSVPTADMRQGNFSGTNYAVFDPSTTVCASSGTIGNCANNDYTRTEFPNDTIPNTDINSIGQAIVNYYPAANINNTAPLNNYTANVPDKYRYYQPMTRVDWNTSDKTRFYAMYEYQHGTEFRNYSGFTGVAENGNINTMRNNTVASLDMTHTFSSTMVGDFKASFARFIDNFPDGPLSTPTPSSIGLNMPDVATTTKQLLPEVTYSEMYPQEMGNSVSADVEQNMIFDADFTKTHGAHTIEFGGEFGSYFYGNPGSVGRPNGYFGFGTQYTQFDPSDRGAYNGQNGNVIADLLLGYPDSGGVDWNDTLAEGFPMYAFYAQDNWRVTHKLTLNLGLRYDVQRGVQERYNRLDKGMCLTCINPITNDPTYQANISNASNLAAWSAANAALEAAIGSAGPTVNPGTVYGGFQFPGVDGQSRDAYNTDYSNIAPRLGFAYAINDKTVVRGGAGYMFAYGIEAGTTDGFSISTPYISNLNGITPTDYFQSGTPFPTGAEKPIGTSEGLETDLGNTQEIDFPQRKIPRSQIMSLGVQRALPGNMTLDVSYAGNYTRGLRPQGAYSSYNWWVNGTLPDNWGYNQLQQNDYNSAIASALNTQVPNPYYGVLPSNTSQGGSPTMGVANLLVPLSQYGLIGNWTDPYGKSWFNALEVKLDKRLMGSSRGLAIQLAYTYQKTTLRTNYRNGWPWTDPKPIYELANWDRTQQFVFAGEWDLPFGKGAKYLLTNPSRPVGAIANGWRLSWVLTDASGFPEGMPGGWYTSTHSMVPTGGPTYQQWIYNCGAAGPTSCWTNTPSWSQGNLPDDFGYLRQPYIPNLDLSLEKNVAITESKQLQLRADAFNFMNTPLFGGPDTNQNDGAPTRNSNGTWSGFGTINYYQDNFPRIVQLSLKFIF